MSKFDPEFYRRFRPYYPAELFVPLAAELRKRASAPGPRVADVGCGTGHSTLSMLPVLLADDPEARVIGVDPDPAMLAAARDLCRERGQAVEFVVGSGEETGLHGASFDAVTVGSAFHWMDGARAREEFIRLLKPRGLVMIYEYQFPKSLSNPALNEWIRREFNLRWKAPNQTPRGDFESVTRFFRGNGRGNERASGGNGPRFDHLGDHKVPMILELKPADLTGLILSQSRVLHYEATMDEEARSEFRRTLGEEIQTRLGGMGDRFDFSLQAGLFGLKAP